MIPSKEMSSFSVDGFEIHRQILDPAGLSVLRETVADLAHQSQAACIRHLRSRSEVIDRLSHDSSLTRLLPPGLLPVRSILFDKTPEENWPVAWHQDLTIAVDRKVEVPGYGSWSIKDGVTHVQPPIPLLESMVTLRLHLDDTFEDNGALRVIPESHRHGKIAPNEMKASTRQSAVTCECAAGDVLLMSPLLLHASGRSRKPNRRRVIHLEYAPIEELDEALGWFEAHPRALTPVD